MQLCSMFYINIAHPILLHLASQFSDNCIIYNTTQERRLLLLLHYHYCHDYHHCLSFV